MCAHPHRNVSLICVKYGPEAENVKERKEKQEANLHRETLSYKAIYTEQNMCAKMVKQTGRARHSNTET